MFTWICPKCGREVPPAYTECPNCNPQEAPAPVSAPAEQGTAGHTAAETSAAPPDAGGSTRRRPVWSDAGQNAAPPSPPVAASGPTPPVLVPSAASPTVPPAFAPPFSAVAPPPAPKRRIPTWLLTVIFAAAFGGVVFGAYKLINRAPSKPTPVVENPAAKPGAPVNPIQRYIEVAGVRFVEDPKHKDKIQVRFILINHADSADLDGVTGNVTIWGSTRRSEEDAFGSFNFKTDLKAGESKELTEPLTTKKKMYEMPDWQNATTDVQITAPGQ